MLGQSSRRILLCTLLAGSRTLCTYFPRSPQNNCNKRKSKRLHKTTNKNPFFADWSEFVVCHARSEYFVWIEISVSSNLVQFGCERTSAHNFFLVCLLCAWIVTFIYISRADKEGYVKLCKCSTEFSFFHISLYSTNSRCEKKSHKLFT